MTTKNDTLLLAAFRQSTQELIDALQLFTPAQLNEIPFAGSWTPGQVGQHLLKSESGIPVLLNGNTRATERPPEALKPQIESIFLDFSTKMQSPDFILPDNTPQDRDTLTQALAGNRDEVLKLATEKNLDLLLTDFSVPQLGELTGKEWITFVTVHSRRHIHQLKKIHLHITGQAG